MKKFLLPSIFICLLFNSCQSKVMQNKDKKQIKVTENRTETVNVNAANTIDWAGKYQGTLPCSDCQGIKYIIELKKDGNFFLEQEYIGKETVYQDEGFYKWDNTGNKIHLNSNVSPLFLKVEKNQLKVLDEKGKELTGKSKEDYILKKIK